MKRLDIYAVEVEGKPDIDRVIVYVDLDDIRTAEIVWPEALAGKEGDMNFISRLSMENIPERLHS